MPKSNLTLGDSFPLEQARIRQCIIHGKEIGPAGAFYVMVCEDVLQRADRAVMSQDLPAMIAVYQEMKEIKD